MVVERIARINGYYDNKPPDVCFDLQAGDCPTEGPFGKSDQDMTKTCIIRPESHKQPLDKVVVGNRKPFGDQHLVANTRVF